MSDNSMPDWSLDRVRLIEPGHGGSFPYLVAGNGDDLAQWLNRHSEALAEWLEVYGAVLCRGFSVPDEGAFERVARATIQKPFGDYGDLVHRQGRPGIYDATVYPRERAILFHNEASHTDRVPTRQLFYCADADCEGGETPIVDCRAVYDALGERVLPFERNGLTYVRNFIAGLDVSWQDFFGTDDRRVVDQRCTQQGMCSEWREDGTLRVKVSTFAVVAQPRTGRMSFCNQVLLHHVSCLDADTAEALLSMMDPDELPRHVYFGDGSDISEATVTDVLRQTVEHAVCFRWKKHDVLILSNLVVAHARRPFSGKRHILVAIGDPATSTSLRPAPLQP